MAGVDWRAKSLANHSAVSKVTDFSGGRFQVERRALPTVMLQFVDAPRLEAHEVDVILERFSDTSAVVNPRRTNHSSGEARELGRVRRVPVFTMHELFSALSYEDMADREDPDMGFLRNALSNHSAVDQVTEYCERQITILRDGRATVEVV